MCKLFFSIRLSTVIVIDALKLLVGRQEGHLTCEKTDCWFAGGDDLAGALHEFQLSSLSLPAPSSLAAAESRKIWYQLTQVVLKYMRWPSK